MDGRRVPLHYYVNPLPLLGTVVMALERGVSNKKISEFWRSSSSFSFSSFLFFPRGVVCSWSEALTPSGSSNPLRLEPKRAAWRGFFLILSITIPGGDAPPTHSTPTVKDSNT